MDPALRNDLTKDLHEAVERVDDLLMEKETHDLAHVSEQFSCLVRFLARLRGHLIAAHREGSPVPDLPSLKEVNAMISLMASIEYPRAGIQWQRIKLVRDHLSKMLPAKQVH